MHKSALPVPPHVPRPPKNPQKQPEAAAPRSRGARPYEPPAYRSGSGETPSSLIGPNLSALASHQANLTDSSPFAQSLERKSSGLSRSSMEGSEPEAPSRTVHSRAAARCKQEPDIPDEEVLRELGLSGDSGTSSRSTAALVKKD